MNFRFPTLSLLTIALLLSPSLLQAGITQTVQTPNASQPTEPTGDRAAEADRLYEHGEQQLQTSEYQLALETFDQALRLYREADNQAGEGETLNNIGALYLYLRRYPQASEQFQQALAIAREAGNRAGEGVTLSNIGTLYLYLGQYPQALEYYQQALAFH